MSTELPAEVRDIAERILTPKQLEAFKLEQAGLGLQRIARLLGVTKTAVVSRIDAAHLKLLRAGCRQDASGRWFVEESA